MYCVSMPSNSSKHRSRQRAWHFRGNGGVDAEGDNAAAVAEDAERERCGRAGPVARERFGQTAEAGAIHWRRHREERRRRAADHLRPTQAARLARGGAERRERAGACLLYCMSRCTV